MINWYIFIGKLNSALSPLLTQLAQKINLPVVTAFLLGLLGSTAPCQLSTNTGALGLIAQKSGDKKATISAAISFILGKALVYTILGGITILLGIRLNHAALPVVQVVRKAMGPLMLLVGVYLLGWRKLNISLGLNLEQNLTRFIPENSNYREFALGVVFSLAFCPTLFWLFFGMLVPLGLSTRGGLILPGIFAIGTAVPLLLITLLLVYSSDKAKGYIADMRKVNLWAQRIGGLLFVLAGINDIIAYWLL